MSGETRYLPDIIAARSDKISQFPFDVDLLHCGGVTATRCVFWLSRTLLCTTFIPPFLSLLRCRPYGHDLRCKDRFRLGLVGPNIDYFSRAED